jgi:hypothetical protein
MIIGQDTTAREAFDNLVDKLWPAWRAECGPGGIRVFEFIFSYRWRCMDFFQHMQGAEGLYAISTECLSWEEILVPDAAEPCWQLTVKCTIGLPRRNPPRAARAPLSIHRPFPCD